MLIGIDASRALRARRTGTERYSLEIIRHLLRLPQAAGHSWRLYTDGQDIDALQDLAVPASNVDICRMPARRLWTHRTLASEIVRRPPDVLFVPAHVVPWLPPWRHLPPTVVTIHDLGYHVFPAAHTRSQRLYLELSTRWSVTAATRVIAVSQATAADLVRFYDVDLAKIDVVYEACAEPSIVEPDRLADSQQRWRLRRPYALFVGTLQPRKNLVRLAQAYAQLLHRNSVAWDLVLAGAPGWLSDKLMADIEGMGLGDRLHLLGYVADDDLPALLQGARFFCYPSLFEGFGLPVLEAQSYGVPVMTSTNSSLPEVAGDAALLVDPTDVDAIAAAMLRLSQDEALRQQLIEAGYANVKRFSWEKAARETLAVLEKAAKKTNADEHR